MPDRRHPESRERGAPLSPPLTQQIYADSNLPYDTHGQPDQPHATDQVYTGAGCTSAETAQGDGAPGGFPRGTPPTR